MFVIGRYDTTTIETLSTNCQRVHCSTSLSRSSSGQVRVLVALGLHKVHDAIVHFRQALVFSEQAFVLHSHLLQPPAKDAAALLGSEVVVLHPLEFNF